MLDLSRVVIHVDLDCFYAQVEHVRLHIPRNVPLAVQQWDSLIAVNYKARESGVKRGERASEAKNKCPDLVLVHVETIGCEDGKNRSSGKVSLERYRSASAKIFEILRKFADVCEKAGLDEAFLDITSKVSELTSQELNWEEEYEKLLLEPSSHYEPTEEHPGGVMVVLEGPLEAFNFYDRSLLAASIYTRRLQREIAKELGFSISVGVACNKLLAKVASGMNKPSRVTVVPPRAVPSLMDSLPLKKVRNLGGKIGQELQVMGFTTSGQVQSLSKKELTDKFGERTAEYIWNAVRGFHDEPVEEKHERKSILAAKSFSCTSDMVAIRRWIFVLSEEIAMRMTKEMEENFRKPKVLHLYYRGATVGDKSKCISLPRQATSALFSCIGNDTSTSESREDEKGSTSCTKGTSSSQDNCKPKLKLIEELAKCGNSLFLKAEGALPCSRLALAASDFESVEKTGMIMMQKFLSEAKEGDDKVVHSQILGKNHSVPRDDGEEKGKTAKRLMFVKIPGKNKEETNTPTKHETQVLQGTPESLSQFNLEEVDIQEQERIFRSIKAKTNMGATVAPRSNAKPSRTRPNNVAQKKISAYFGQQ